MRRAAVVGPNCLLGWYRRGVRFPPICVPYLQPGSVMSCSGYLTRTLNSDGSLADNATGVTLSPDRSTMHVFRKSGRVPAAQSLDCYTFTCGRWSGPVKDPQKYTGPPEAPVGAVTYVLDGIEVTSCPVASPDRDCLRAFLLQTMTGLRSNGD